MSVKIRLTTRFLAPLVFLGGAFGNGLSSPGVTSRGRDFGVDVIGLDNCASSADPERGWRLLLIRVLIFDGGWVVFFEFELVIELAAVVLHVELVAGVSPLSKFVGSSRSVTYELRKSVSVKWLESKGHMPVQAKPFWMLIGVKAFGKAFATNCGIS